MSDTKLRELERRWKETGTVDDEAAFLLERVRTGDLTRERLELAAYCGHRAAMIAAGVTPGPDDPHDFVAGLARFGAKVLMAAGLATARACLPLMGADRAVGAAALEEKERWAACPCLAHEALVRSAGALRPGLFEAGWVVYMACQAPVYLREDDRGRPQRVEDPVAAAAQVVRVAVRPLGASALRRAICDRLIPDALSRGARPTP